eukprot:CFRG1383T1
MQSAQENELMAQQLVQALEKTVDEQIEQLSTLKSDDLSNIRTQRLKQKKLDLDERRAWVTNGHGSLSEITDERDFFEAAKKSRRMVVLFYRSGSAVCDVMQQHMRRLAETHMETKFLSIDATKTPFLVERLSIFVMPTVLTVKEGKTEQKFKGFDSFGGSANVHTGVIESVLHSVGTLQNTPIADGAGSQVSQSTMVGDNGNDSDLDWE